MILNSYQKEILQAVAEDQTIKEIAANYKQPYASINSTLERMRKTNNCQTNVSLVLKALLHDQIEWPSSYQYKQTA